MAKDNTPSESNLVPSWLAIPIIIVIALIVWLIIVSLNEQPNNKIEVNNPQIVIDEGDPIYSYVGIITLIKGSTLQIQVPTLKEKGIIYVNTDNHTSITRLSLPKSSPHGQKLKTEREIITFNNLQVGDNITVSSNNNINNKHSFVADRIEIRMAQ